MSKKESRQIEMAIDLSEGTKKFVIDPEEYVVYKKAQLEANEQKKMAELDREKDERGRFTMGRHEPLKSYNTKLNAIERRCFMSLLPYSKKTNKPLQDEEGNLLKVPQIMEIFSLSHARTSAIMNKLSTDTPNGQGLLIAGKDGRSKVFTLNPEYFAQTSGYILKDEKFTKVFLPKLEDVTKRLNDINEKKSCRSRVLRSLIKDRDVDVRSALGLLHAMIPYFHYQSYFLVENPNEDISVDGLKLEEIAHISDKLEFIKPETLMSAMGHETFNYLTYQAYMEALVEAGALSSLRYKKIIRYIVHPDLMYRIDNKYAQKYDVNSYDVHVISTFFRGETRRKEIKLMIKALKDMSKA